VPGCRLAAEWARLDSNLNANFGNPASRRELPVLEPHQKHGLSISSIGYALESPFDGARTRPSTEPERHRALNLAGP
jgi:hypothetical protein